MEAAWSPELGYPYVQELPAGEDLPSEYTWNVVWDEEGRAYFGRERLWRWNGIEMEALGPDIFRYLRGLAMDDAGLLWLGGVNQFGVLDPGTGHYESRLDWIPEEHRDFGDVWTLHHDGDGLWMGTHDRLFNFKDGGAEVWKFGGRHRVIFHFVSGKVFAHEAEVGLWEIRDGEKILVNTEEDVVKDSILFIDEFDDGLLHGFSKHGLLTFSDDGSKLLKFTSNPLGDVFVSCGIRYSDKIIVGTLGMGAVLMSLDGKIIFVFGSKETEQRNLILNIIQGPEGSFWVLNSFALEVLNLNLSVGYADSRLGLPYSDYRATESLGTSTLVATDKGVLTYSMSGEGNNLSLLSEGETKYLVPYKGGYLFDRYNRILYTEGGEPDEVARFTGEIMSFTRTEDILWISFDDRVEAYRISGTEDLELVWELLTDSRISRLGVDGRGTVWGWSPYGPLLELEYLESGAVRSRWHSEAAGVDLRLDNHEFAITKRGPLLVLKDRLLHFDIESRTWEIGVFNPGRGSLPEAMVFHARGSDLLGWFLYWDEQQSSNLMMQVEWASEGVPEWSILPWIDMKPLGKVSSLEVVDGEERKFIIGGQRGLLMATEQLTKEIPPPRAPLIYDGDGLFLSEARQEAGFGENLFRFRFSPPLGETVYPVHFETRLKGRDSSWLKSDFPGSRELGQLFEGSYAFEVRTVDPFGRRSPVASVAIQVNPPWYRSSWTYLAIALSILTAFYAILRIRERRARQMRERLEALVRQRTADLEKANEFKDDFIANLSHEIRNPLNGVIGLIRQVSPGVSPPERYLKALQGAAHYLQTTVEEVLDFAKLQSGELRIERTLFDLQEMVNGVIEIYRSQALAKGIELTAQVRLSEGVGVVSDAAKVQQIIGNLTGNAVKFTQTGSVHVGVVLKQDGPASGDLSIWVEDSGPGIAEADREKIFDKFYQVDRDVQKASGTGLGLALVKRYTECLDGQVEVLSEVGKGSKFQVVLPVRTEALPDTGTQEKAGREWCLDGLPVLVVEDIEYNRVTLESQLSQLGCLVDFAENGLDGLKMAMSGKYRVIFLDWDLPGMKGIEIARNLRSGNHLPEGTRLIGMTAFATSDVREKCLSAGMDDFLTKPLSTAQIRKLLMQGRDDYRLIVGRGLLAEMASGKSWESTIERWIGFHDTYLGELKDAMETGDPGAVHKAAHRVLGHMRMLEVRQLPDTLKRLLTAAHGGDMSGISKEWETLQVELAEFAGELQRFKMS